MGLDFSRRAVELQERYGAAGQRVGSSIQTNSMLLDSDEWCRFLHVAAQIRAGALVRPAQLT